MGNTHDDTPIIDTQEQKIEDGKDEKEELF